MKRHKMNNPGRKRNAKRCSLKRAAKRGKRYSA